MITTWFNKVKTFYNVFRTWIFLLLLKRKIIKMSVINLIAVLFELRRTKFKFNNSYVKFLKCCGQFYPYKLVFENFFDFMQEDFLYTFQPFAFKNLTHSNPFMLFLNIRFLKKMVKLVLNLKFLHFLIKKRRFKRFSFAKLLFFIKRKRLQIFKILYVKILPLFKKLIIKNIKRKIIFFKKWLLANKKVLQYYKINYLNIPISELKNKNTVFSKFLVEKIKSNNWIFRLFRFRHFFYPINKKLGHVNLFSSRKNTIFSTTSRRTLHSSRLKHHWKRVWQRRRFMEVLKFNLRYMKYKWRFRYLRFIENKFKFNKPNLFRYFSSKRVLIIFKLYRFFFIEKRNDLIVFD